MSIYSFNAKDIDGTNQSLDQYKEKVLLIVNTASKCGFTPQYEDLEKIYEAYKGQGLEILGFPCNQFNAQEPGTSEDTKSFCSLNYGVTFPLFEKIDVNGAEAHPLFKYLKDNAPFEGLDLNHPTNKILDVILKDKYPEYTIGNAIRWNFTKFLVDRNGNIVGRFESSFEPKDLIPHIESLI